MSSHGRREASQDVGPGSPARDLLDAPAAKYFLWPLAVGAALLFLQAAARQPSFWLGVAASLPVGLLAGIVVLALWARGAERRLVHVETTRTTEARTRELERELALVAAVALPVWVRVAIAHTRRRGGDVSVTPNGLRFAASDGTELVTLHLPLGRSPLTDGLEERRVAEALGIDQRAYMEALLDVA